MSTLSSMARAPSLDGARAMFTTRRGGGSTAPYDALNLARHVGDEDEVVERNRALLRSDLGVPLQFVDQVHSETVLVLPAHGEAPATRADAMVTDRDDVALVIMVADCLPVLLCDPEAGVIGAAHAGRRGLLGGILENTLAAMRDLGAQPARTRAAIGPGICGRCYEVPAQMHREAVDILPDAHARTPQGTPALDLRAGAVQALRAVGLEAAAIDAGYPCTAEDDAYYSYRRDGRTGRFVGVIRRY